MKKQAKKLTIQKETLKQLQGGKIIGYYKTIPIDDTVYYPVHSDRCSIGCGGTWV